MQIKQSKQKPYNQLIQQLRSEGLYLTDEKRIKLPVCMSPPPSIFTRIISLISNKQKFYDMDSKKKIWPLQENYLIVTQCNTLSIYLIEKVEQSIDAQQMIKFHMEELIQSLTFSYYQNFSEMDQIFFVIIYIDSPLMSLFSIKCKAKNKTKNYSQLIQLKHQINVKNDILTLEFISKNQFLLVTNKYVIYHYKIQNESLKLIRQIGPFREIHKINKQENLIFVKLKSKPKQEQDSLIAVFYATWNSQTNRCQISVKQMLRQLDGTISIKQQTYQLFSFFSLSQINKEKSAPIPSQSKSQQKEALLEEVRIKREETKKHLKQVEIINQKDCFMLKLNHQIFIIAKLFQKYVRLDAITQNFTSFKSLLISDHVPLICCIGQDSMELWHTSLSHKKSKCVLMDVINLNQETNIKEHQFLRFWVINYENRIETIFAFDQGKRQISLFGVKKIDKVSKLINKLNKTSQRDQIVKTQELGQKLGIDRKTLYLQLWNESIKNPANIYQYLLQSYDLPSIHSELQKYMRHKFISTGQLVKIHTEIQNILLHKLQHEQLNFNHLKWFLKTNFQKRKLSMYSFSTQITFKEFQVIYNSSIFQLIDKRIKKSLFPQKLNNIKWNQKPVEEPDINIIHVLQEFKLLILQNFEEFLHKILNYYKFNVVQVFSQFPDLLPKHPFSLQVFHKQQAPFIIEETKKSSKSKIDKSGKEEKGEMQTREHFINQNKKIQRQISKTSILQSINFHNENEAIKKQKPNQQGESSTQYQKIWFSEVTQQQWLQQKSSVDYLFSALYPHYQTHQIMILITQLIESEWYSKNKFNSHCLIVTTLNSFKQKLSKIQGIKLYLLVCEFVNRAKLQAQERLLTEKLILQGLHFIIKDYEDLATLNEEQSKHSIFQVPMKELEKNIVSQAPKFLNVMKLKNNLDGEGYQTCLLYSKMHDLMIGKEIVKRGTTIFELMASSHSSLIAEFFIGNKQRNIQLFNDFMPLYNDKKLFYEALNQYIKSKNCSRVQLQILVNELTNRKSDYKDQNNNLAQLLIYGFCLRTQIRQKQQAHTIIEIIKDIELKLDLVLKLQKFIVIKQQLTHIFQFFGCGKLSYEEVLNQPKKVLKVMLENYFNNNLNFDSLFSPDSYEIKIQDRVIYLGIVQNTFSIFLYLRQKLYVQIPEIQLSIFYGEIMIQWQQFQALKQIFDYQAHQQNPSFNTVQYFEKLIVRVLNSIYTKQNVYMNEAITFHIESIINLLEYEVQGNPLIIRQKAKLELSKNFEKWGFRVQSITLELICIKWCTQENREELVYEILNNCIEYFDLQELLKLYRLLETTRLGYHVEMKEIKNEQSIKLAYQLAYKLAEYRNNSKQNHQQDDKDNQICDIIHFINMGEKNTYRAELGLMIETFLRMVKKKYGQDPFILQEELKSQYADYKKQDRILQYQKPLKSPRNYFLQVNNQLHQKRLSKSYRHDKYNISFSSSVRGDKKSYQQNRKKSKSRTNLDNSQNNYTKRSLRRMSNAKESEVQTIKFDDPPILQRIFNYWRKDQSLQLSPNSQNLCKDITQIGNWHMNGKQLIQYFVMNWQNTAQINQMFRNKFSREVWNNSPFQCLNINQKLCLKMDDSAIQPLLYNQTAKMWKISIDLNLVWSVNVKLAKEYIKNYIFLLKTQAESFYQELSQKFCKILYEGYFFILMTLRNPQSLSKMKYIHYEHFSNVQLIHQFQKTVFGVQKGVQTFKGDNIIQLHRINFEQIWKKYYVELKKEMIQKIKQLQPEIKLKQDIETKLLEKLAYQMGANKSKIMLYLKILYAIEAFLSKYIKEAKPKALNQLKKNFESKMIQIINTSPLLSKNTTKKQPKPHEQRDNYKITLNQVNQLKEKLAKQMNQMAHNNSGMGYKSIEIDNDLCAIRQIAEVFEEIKNQSKNKQKNNILSSPSEQQSLKQVIFNKMISKRQFNTSEIRQAQSFFIGKQHKQQRPFQSSIILQSKLFQEPNYQLRDSGFKEFNKNKFKSQKKNSFESEYFNKSQRSEIESIINIKSDNKNLSNYSSDFLDDKSNFQEKLAGFKLPYSNLLYPVNEVTKQLAVKDAKFEKKYHFERPISQINSNKIKQFSKLLNAYELYLSKNSKHYIQETLKKMKNVSSQTIIQVLQQLYYESDSILITLNPKQLETNRLRKQKGLGCQEQKYFQAEISYIFSLVQHLVSNQKSLLFQIVVENINKFGKKMMEKTQVFLDQKAQNNKIKDQEQNKGQQNNKHQYTNQNQACQKQKAKKNFTQNMKNIFPLNDLIKIEDVNSQNFESISLKVQQIFGRVYLSNIATNQNLSFDQFCTFIEFMLQVLEQLKNKFTQNEATATKQETITEAKSKYNLKQLKNYFVCMLIWQILKFIEPTNFMKQKLQYLMDKMSKQFITEVYPPTELLLKNNSQLQGVFSVKILNIF